MVEGKFSITLMNSKLTIELTSFLTLYENGVSGSKK